MKLRIANVVHSLGVGGLERTVVSLSNQLNARGHRVWLFCLRNEGPLAQELSPDVSLLSMNAKSNEMGLPGRLHRCFRQARLDVVHTHNWNAWPDALLAAKLAGCHSTIQTFHGFIEAMPFRRRLASRVLSRITDHSTVVSRDLAGEASVFCGQPASRFKIIHNGIDCVQFRPKADMPQPDWSGKNRVSYWCVVVGSLTPAKDPMNMLRALWGLPENVGLVWVGDGPLANDAALAARQLGISHRVFWAGVQADVRPWLAMADVVVSSSKSEAFPLNVLEAMAMCKPVVATCVGGTSEAMTSGADGILVPSEKPEELSRAIEALLIDASMRKRLGEKARLRVKEAFNLEAMVDQYESLYFAGQSTPTTCSERASA